MQLSPLRLAFLALIALLVTATSGAQAQTPTPLPPLTGFDQAEAIWINDKGLIVGNSRSSSFSPTAMMWDEHGTPKRLRPLIGETNAFIAPAGDAINSKGEVAGGSGGQAVVWDRNGTPTALGPGHAVAISNNGLVAGAGFFGAGPSVPVRWDQKGRPTVLSSDGNDNALSINNKGEVAGWREPALPGERFIAKVWDRNGTERVLEVGALAFSINGKGQVAGRRVLDGPGANWRALLWDRNGTATVLPPLPGDTRAAARGINQRGEVVGQSFGSSSPSTGVVWDQDGNPTALSPLAGDTGSVASGINKRGVVVGVSFDSAGNSTAVEWEWCGGDSRRCR